MGANVSYDAISLALLKKLVSIPSLSGSEEIIGKELWFWTTEHKHCVNSGVSNCGVQIIIDSGEPGKTLVLASHLDTVPPGGSWNIDPYIGMIENNYLIGRGSVDAKASVAAMCMAAMLISVEKSIKKGKLVVLATYGEETKNSSMPLALTFLETSPDAVIIGEPTNLQVCIAQKGLLILKLICNGDQIHAGHSDFSSINAIRVAADELVYVLNRYRLNLCKTHPLLGGLTFTPTIINAGVSNNVTPFQCEVTIDVRTIPDYTHNEIISRIKECLSFYTSLKVISDRLAPCETLPNSLLLKSILNVNPTINKIGSNTCSDWIYTKDYDVVKLGPGDSSMSHVLNEKINIQEFLDSIVLYKRVVEDYLG